jgi:MiaB-like protein
LESVIANAEKIVAAGTYEIVLTGVNTGDWGRGLDTGQKFFDLVKALDNVEGLRRVRISSIEPNLITDEILEYIASGDKFMPHFHIPLQSGCDDILRAMKRRYLTPLYRSRIEKIKELMPHACIGADVIVGFPGETEANFEETYRFISSLDVSYLHVFTYSERENTPAWSMAGSVPGKVRAKRSKVLHLLGGRKKAAFYRSQLGSVRPVLFESENKDGMISGFTDNYVKVRLPWEDGLANTIRNVRLDGADAEGEITCSLVK